MPLSAILSDFEIQICALPTLVPLVLLLLSDMEMRLSEQGRSTLDRLVSPACGASHWRTRRPTLDSKLRTHLDDASACRKFLIWHSGIYYVGRRDDEIRMDGTSILRAAPNTNYFSEFYDRPIRVLDLATQSGSTEYEFWWWRNFPDGWDHEPEIIANIGEIELGPGQIG
jgi:hypothetical protein